MLKFTGSTAIDYLALQPRETVPEVAKNIFNQPEFRQDLFGLSPISPPMRTKLLDPFVKKLELFVHLKEADLQALNALLVIPRAMRAGQILIHEGSVLDQVYLVVQGMACRYKSLPDGERQILGYLIPGDLCDIQFTTLNKTDHSVALLSDAQIIKISTHKISALLSNHPRIERALSHAASLDIAILREWLLNVGQRNAVQKLSHFFCEMKLRLERIGHVAQDGSFELPINQRALADTTGLTPVHVNRTLQRLRGAGLICLGQRRLLIVDADRLATIAGFDDNYLQVEQCAG